MKMHSTLNRRLSLLSFTALMAFSLTSQLSASVLLIDFGPNAAVDPDRSFSPAHQDGGLSASLNNWNTVTTDVSAGGLVYADDTTATGVALDVGVGDGAGNNANFGTFPSSTVTGTQAAAWGDSPLRDGIFHTVGSIVVRLSGLSTGNYDIYFTGRNTNGATAYTATLYAVASASAITNIASSSTASATAVDTSTTAVTIYVADLLEGEHYAKLSGFNVSSGQDLYLAWDASSSEARPFATSLAIVAIPEPGVLSLLALAVLGLRAYIRRRSL